MTYYAVQKGLHPGIYDTWDECKAQTSGVKGAVYKKFSSLEDAEAFVNTNGYTVKQTEVSTPVSDTLPEEPYAFVDGSFNADTGTYGYGGFLCANGAKYVLYGHDRYDLEMAGMRNVAGEISGVRAAILKAKALGLTELTIFYDYAGIEAWVTGAWHAKTNCTLSYRAFMLNCGITVHFEKVKAHTGIAGNEDADKIAKYAVGIELPKKQQDKIVSMVQDHYSR